MAAVTRTIEQVAGLEKYKHGFVTDIEQDFAPKGLNADIVRFISAKKNEPQWMLDWRLEAFERWLAMDEPDWAKVSFPKIDYQDSYYYAAPKEKVGIASLDEVDPDILETYKKLGIPLREQEVLAGVVGAPRYAVDAVFDSVSVVTTFKKELAQVGVIFCSMSEAIREHPELVKQYLGTVVPVSDNYFACLLRRQLRLRAAGRPLPDGAVDLFPDQRREFRPVRAHPDHRGQGRLRLVPGGLHGPHARREPAARRRGRTDRPRRRGD
jgi:Fe-S cluster assembly protein SufB